MQSIEGNWNELISESRCWIKSVSDYYVILGCAPKACARVWLKLFVIWFTSIEKFAFAFLAIQKDCHYSRLTIKAILVVANKYTHARIYTTRKKTFYSQRYQIAWLMEIYVILITSRKSFLIGFVSITLLIIYMRSTHNHTLTCTHTRSHTNPWQERKTIFISSKISQLIFLRFSLFRSRQRFSLSNRPF